MNRYKLHQSILKNDSFYARPGYEWKPNPAGIELIAGGNMSWPFGNIKLINWLDDTKIICKSQSQNYMFNLLLQQLLIYDEPVYE